MNPLIYEQRICEAVGTLHIEDICCKLYVIRSALNSRAITPSMETLHTALAAEFAAWNKNDADHSFCFAIVHFANDGCYLLISRWNDANNLRHRVCSINIKDGRVTAHLLDDRSIIACIWEMRLMVFEVNTWIDNILKTADGSITPEASERYLSTVYNGPL